MTDYRKFEVDYGDGTVFTATPLADTTGWRGFRIMGVIKGMQIQVDIENAAPTRVFQVINNLVEANL